MATGKDKLAKMLDQFKEEPRGAWLVEDAPREAIPGAMDSVAAMRLVSSRSWPLRECRRGNQVLRHHLDGA